MIGVHGCLVGLCYGYVFVFLILNLPMTLPVHHYFLYIDTKNALLLLSVDHILTIVLRPQL